ncbi:MAG TPA: ATP-binding cassette domain-containing protein [Verrucomicrobiae bacterium]|nr:ATP-binding cassette domain-containing protein [Verrucomicrobiae bacterium]
MAPAQKILMLRLTNILLPLATFDLSIDLELPKRVTAITGPSGAGKTSLLEVIAGLRKLKSGKIELNGIDLTHLRPEKRAIGYVPQDLALFPHLSVERNIYYGGRGGSQISSEHVIKTLQIEPLLSRRITEISGGEQQRVALARALLACPKLLLLDEPLGSLDPELKSKVLPYLCRVRDEFQIPMLYVTHDSAEAAMIAQETIALDKGKVLARSVSS